MQFLKSLLKFFTLLGILLFFLEGSSRLVVVYYFDSFQSDNYSEKQIKGLASFNVNEIGDISERQGKMPHPYFSYINAEPEYYGIKKKNWSKNFEKISNFKYSKRSEVFRIGFFGGSVAQQLVGFEHISGILKSRLEGSNEFEGKTIEIVDFTSGGYKQPQSLFIATLYEQSFDMAINFEGRNELSYIHSKKFPPYYPSRNFSRLYYSDFQALKHFVSLGEASRRLKKIPVELKKANFLNHSYLLSLISFSYWKFRFNSFIEEKIAYERKYFFDRKQDQTYWDQAKLWLKMSCMQQNMLASLNKASLFFVQPLPYFKKPLSIEEKKLIGKMESSEFQSEAKKVYSRLEKIDLESSNINLVNISDIFEGDENTRYIDDCCHINENASEIVLIEISKIITQKAKSHNLIKPCNINILKDFQ